MRTLGVSWGIHIRREHVGKGKKSWIKCLACWVNYSLICFTYLLIPWVAKVKKDNNKYMWSEILTWFLIIIAMAIPPLITALINYYADKKKKAAETEKIKLQNKITKEILTDD